MCAREIGKFWLTHSSHSVHLEVVKRSAREHMILPNHRIQYALQRWNQVLPAGTNWNQLAPAGTRWYQLLTRFIGGHERLIPQGDDSPGR